MLTDNLNRKKPFGEGNRMFDNCLGRVGGVGEFDAKFSQAKK